jgi:hypothetical protein
METEVAGKGVGWLPQEDRRVRKINRINDRRNPRVWLRK